MDKLGTIFGIIAAMLAIVAAVLSFMISQKRTMYEERTGELAAAVSQMVANIDPTGTSGVPASASYTAADAEAGEAESGALSWAKYMENPSDYESGLSQAVTLASDINEQRNELAEALTTVGSALNMPDADLDPANLRDLGDEQQFSAAKEDIVGHAQAVASRDQAMIAALERAAQAMDESLNATALTQREEVTDEDGNVTKGAFPYEPVLDEFTGSVAGVVKRSEEYAGTLLNAVETISTHDWAVDPSKITDEREYVSALTALQNDFGDINEQLGLYQKAQEQIAELKERRAQLTESNEELRDGLDEASALVSKLKDRLEIYEGSLGGITEDGQTLNPNLTGKVLHVNDEWDFVIVDVGRQDAIQENFKMLVARGDKLVGKLQLSKVLSKISVGEILPETQVDSVQVGDRVILPESQE